MLIPIHDRIIVRPDVTAAVTTGGIHIPEACRGAESAVRRGVIQAIGPGAPLPNGGTRIMSVRCGEIVYFGKSSGFSLPASGEDGPLLVLREEDVLAVDQAYVETKTQHMTATICGSRPAS